MHRTRAFPFVCSESTAEPMDCGKPPPTPGILVLPKIKKRSLSLHTMHGYVGDNVRTVRDSGAQGSQANVYFGSQRIQASGRGGSALLLLLPLLFLLRLSVAQSPDWAEALGTPFLLLSSKAHGQNLRWPQRGQSPAGQAALFMAQLRSLSRAHSASHGAGLGWNTTGSSREQQETP